MHKHGGDDAGKFRPACTRPTLKNGAHRTLAGSRCAVGSVSETAIVNRQPGICGRHGKMGLVGILVGLALLMWLAYRGRSVLLVSPLCALVAAAFSGEPLLAHWTQTFMGGAARFVAQWFPMFLLGGLFGKLMQDSGSISAIAQYLTKQLGTKRTMLAVVI